MIIGDAYVAVKGDTKGFSSSTEAGVLNSVRSTAKKAAVIFGAAFSGRIALRGITDAIKAGDESNKVAADSAQVIKTTGGAAHITAEQMGELATAISLKTGVDDEAIQSAENMLATFTNLRNEVGKGNDVFNQASQLAVDMGAKFKNGPEAASIQLGKALNDPIKGITALTRVGVSFTEQQKDQIKALVDSGDRLGAQKIILAELTKEFGGIAEATATASDKIKVAFGNVKEGLGQAIAPALEALAPTLVAIAQEIGPIVAGLGSTIGYVIQALAGAVQPLVDALEPVIQQISSSVAVLAPVIGRAFADLVPIIAPIGTAIFHVAEALAPLLETLAVAAGTILPPLLRVFDSLVQAVTPIIAIVAQFVGIIVKGLGPSLGKIADVVAVVAHAFAGEFSVVLVKLQPLFARLGEMLVKLTPVILRIASAVGGALIKAFEILAPVLLKVATVVINELVKFLPQLADVLLQIFEAAAPLLPVFADLGAQLLEGLAPVLPMIADALLQILQAIVPLMPQLVDLAKQLGKTFVETLLQIVPLLPDLIESLTRLVIAILPLIPPLLKLAELFNQLMTPATIAIINSVAVAIELVANALSSVAEWIGRIDFPGLFNQAFSVISTIQGLPSLISQAVSGMFDSVGREAGKLPGQLADLFGRLPGVISGKAGDVAAAAADMGKRIIDGLVRGLGGLAAKAGELAGRLLDAVKRIGASVINGIIDAINSILPNKIGAVTVKGVTIFPGIDLPDNPVPRVKLASGAIVKSRFGGVDATIGEGRFNEAVLPLPSGVLEGLQRIAAAPAGATGGGTTFQIDKVELSTSNDPRKHAGEFLDRLADELWLGQVPA